MFKLSFKVLSETTVAVLLKFFGTSPFQPGKNRFIGTAAVPIAFKAGQDVPVPIIHSELPVDFVINKLETTKETANEGELYYSINMAARGDVHEMVIGNEEIEFFTITFPKGIPDGFKLLNVAYRHDISVKGGRSVNDQAQVTIEDNWANEYTAPFTNPSDIFYPTEGHAKIGDAGEGDGGDMGFIRNTYNSFAERV